MVSDDPDDHQLLSEAIKEVSENIILTIMMEDDHLFQVLAEEKIRPDFIVVDTAMKNTGKDFMSRLSSSAKLKNIPVIIYTDNTANTDHHPPDRVLSKRLTYREMRSKLKTILLPP